jgi:hypothetical protein
VGAVVLGQVPDTDASSTVTADDLTLVWMNDDVIDWGSMRIRTLDSSAACLPNLDSSVLRASDHPFALTVECDTGDVVRVTFESQDRIWVCRFDIVELDIVVASGSEETFIWRDTETIDLGVRVLNGARADTRESLPESMRCG